MALVKWLNGLRGVASLLVYWHHQQLWWHHKHTSLLERGWGYHQKFCLATFPFIRTLFTGGHFAVAVLFVISGYAISIKPLQQTRAQDYVGLNNTLASAFLRRWPRLFIPFLFVTFVYMSSWYVPGMRASLRPPTASDSWSVEVRSWLSEAADYTFVFSNLKQPWFSYNNHMWSLPLEFRGSILCLAALLSLSRCTQRTRLCSYIGLMFYFLYFVDGWYCALYLSGMLLRGLDDIREHPEPKQKSAKYNQNTAKVDESPYVKGCIISTFIFVFGIYLGNVPHVHLGVLRQTPGWRWLSLLKPTAMPDPKWFYLFWAASFVVFSISRLPKLKFLLEKNAPQQLGRLSFSLYLIQGPILWTVGPTLDYLLEWDESYVMEQNGTTSSGPLGMEVGFLLAQAILFPISVCYAHLLEKMLGQPLNRLLQYYSLTLFNVQADNNVKNK